MMNRLVPVLFAACAVASSACGRSFSLDLCTQNRGASRARLLSAAPAEDDGTLRSFDLGAGVADVGEIAVGDELTVTLFDDVTLTLALKEKMPSPLGGDVFLAEAGGYDGIKTAVVFRKADGLTIDVQDFRNGKCYKVLSTPTGVKVREVDAHETGSCACNALPPQGAVVTRTAVQSGPRLLAAPSLMSVPPEEDVTCVDILIAYDKNAAAWARSNGGGITNFAETAVQKMNVALSNSGLGQSFRFRLLEVMEVDVSSSYPVDALEAATDGKPGWGAIRMRREKIGADIVTVLIDTGTPYGVTGYAWGLKMRYWDGFAQDAYNVCSIRSVDRSHTMTHEVGHNLGCGHNEDHATDPGPQLYDYSAGYKLVAGGSKYHTIMVHGAEGTGSTEIPYFSSPSCGYMGVTLGDESHDNARTLANTFAFAASWRGEFSGTAPIYVTVPDDCAEMGEINVSGGSLTAKVNSKVTLKATPKKGCVFAGWWLLDYDASDGREELLSQATTFTYVATGRTVFLEARFALVEDDIASLAVDVEDMTSGEDGTVELDLAVRVTSLTPPKLAVSDLPPGVKFDTKTGLISGKATKPGVYEVKVTVTNTSATGKNGVERKFKITVPNLTTPTFMNAGLDTAGKYLLWAGVLPGDGRGAATVQRSLNGVLSEIADAGWKLALSGLPSGIKFDAKKNELSGVATKEGFYTVYFTATRGSGKTAEKEIATATLEVQFPTLTLDTAAWRDTVASGKATGGGRFPAGTKVTLKATPANGCVFVGWYEGGAQFVGTDTGAPPLSQAASYSYVTTDEDVKLAAVFATADEEKRSISLALNGEACPSAETTLATNIMCGVALSWPIAASALSEPKVKVTGLPAGLKFTDKDILKKGSKTEVEIPANTIYGAPSAASKVDAKKGLQPSEVTFTVTTAGKSTATYRMKVTVDPLPAWAVGNFEGVAGAPDSIRGSATMSVTSAGKISGKIALGGTNWTFKADSFAGIGHGVSGAATPSAQTNFSVVVAATAGKDSCLMSLAVSDCPIADLPGSATAMASGTFGEAPSELFRLPWADKGDAAAVQLVASYAGAYSCTIVSGNARCPCAFTLDEKGAVKGAILIPIDNSNARLESFAGNALAQVDGLYATIAVPPDVKRGYPSLFECRRLVGHSRNYNDPTDGLAYRDPGVIASTAARTAGSGASGTVAVSPKYGQVASGKDVSVSAKADKNSVFSCWIVTGIDTTGLDLTSSSLKFKASGSDVHVTAQFVTLQEDLAAIRLFVDGMDAPLWGEVNSPGMVNGQKSVPCGAVVDWPVHVQSCSQATVKAEKLPDGLKLVQDKATKAYSIVGVPTKAAEFAVKFTVTTAGKSKETVLLPIKVEPMPADIVGSYVGLVGEYADAAETGWRAVGMVTLSVAANGKLSAKATLPSGTYSFASNGWESAVDGVYKVAMTTKAGDRLYLELNGKSGCDWRSARVSSPSALEIAGKPSRVVVAWRNEHGKDGKIASDAIAADFVARIAALKKLCYKVTVDAKAGYAVDSVPATDKSANLTVTLDAKGNVKYSGKIGGTSVSGASTLNVDDGDYYTIGDATAPLGKTEALYFALGFDRNADGTPSPELRIDNMAE